MTRPRIRSVARRGAAVVVAMALASTAAWNVIGAAVAHRATAAPMLQLEAAHAEHLPALDGTEPIFILLLGSDAREGEEVARLRADSIHILAIAPGGAGATLLGFPRDSWVEVPGRGSSKINEVMTLGGPELVVETVEALTGITIDYWALTSFAGLIEMVDDVGGLDIDIPFAMDDPNSGATFEPGPQRITGRQALAFSRNRYGLPAGDFGRSENQGRIAVAAIAQMRAEFEGDPSRLLAWIGAGMGSTQTDLPLDQVLGLAFLALRIDPASIVNAVVPGGTAMVGTSSVVQLSSVAPTIYADLADDGLLSPDTVPASPNASLLD